MAEQQTQEERIERVLDELKRREDTDDVRLDIERIQSILKDPVFRRHSGKSSNKEVRKRCRNKKTELVEDLREFLEQEQGKTKPNQNIIVCCLDAKDVQPIVLETKENPARLLIVGPKDIKNRTSGKVRIGDCVLALATTDEEASKSNTITYVKTPSKSDFQTAVANLGTNPETAFAFLRESTQMVLTGDWTQVEVIRLGTEQGGLGFGIVGGTSTGVVVKTILPGSPADRQGHLRPGDHILQIGNVNTHGMSSQQVATILRQQQPTVEMIVGRPITYSDRPPDSADCFTLATKAALCATSLEEALQRQMATSSTCSATNTISPSLSCQPIEEDTEKLDSTQSVVVSLDLRKPCDCAPVTSRKVEPPDSQPNGNVTEPTTTKICLKSLQEMALTVFLRENWEHGDFQLIEVRLKRDPALGLGITVAGYVHRKEEIGGIFVKSLVPRSAATQCGQINIHDLILEVNGVSLEHLSHADSVRTLVKSGETVSLKLIRFPPASPQAQCLKMLQQQETETQVIDVKSSNPDVADEWKRKLNDEVDIVMAVVKPDSSTSNDGGLGISLEGTVDVLNGHQLCPHHYIESIREHGPVAKTGLLQSGDELLQVNHSPLYGESHVTVRQALTRAVHSGAPVTLIVARRRTKANVYNCDYERSLPLSFPLLTAHQETIVKAKSDVDLSTERSPNRTEEVPVQKLRSRSLEHFNGLAVWNCVPLVIHLDKDARGLGFSVVDYKDPAHSYESVIVVQSLVPGGVAQADGRIVPGDRLLFVNNHDLSNSSLERAVAVLKAARCGTVTLGIAKPIPVDQCHVTSYSPLFSRSERLLARGRSPRSKRRDGSGTTSSQETVWIGTSEQYRKLHPNYCSRSPSCTRSERSDGTESMASWSPCSTRSVSPCASPISIKGSWAYDVIYLPNHLERTVRVYKGPLPLGLVLDADKDKGVNGCVIKSICGKKAIGLDGRLQTGDLIVRINSESMRNITNSQARAILKRTNLVGSHVNITYITMADAKTWKERFHRPSVSSEANHVNRLSPKVFPKFYKSPYLERKGYVGDDTEPTSISSDILDVSTSSIVEEEHEQETDEQRCRRMNNLIDGMHLDRFVQQIIQEGLKDAIVELCISAKTKDWTTNGTRKEEEEEEEEEGKVSTSVFTEKEEEEEKQNYTRTQQEASPSKKSDYLIRRDSEPAIRSVEQQLEQTLVSFEHEPLPEHQQKSVEEPLIREEHQLEQILSQQQELEQTEHELEQHPKEPEHDLELSSKEPEHDLEQRLKKREHELNQSPQQPEHHPEHNHQHPVTPTTKKPSTEPEPSTSEPPPENESIEKPDMSRVTSRTSSTNSDNLQSQARQLVKSKYWGDARTVLLNREPNKSFGISIVGGRVEVSQKGGLPGTGNTVSGIFIKSVLPNSPAGRSGHMNMGDRVISVNDIDLRDATHEQAVNAIKNAQNPVRFVLQSLHSSGQQHMINSASNSTVGSVRIESKPDPPKTQPDPEVCVVSPFEEDDLEDGSIARENTVKRRSVDDSAPERRRSSATKPQPPVRQDSLISKQTSIDSRKSVDRKTEEKKKSISSEQGCLIVSDVSSSENFHELEEDEPQLPEPPLVNNNKQSNSPDSLRKRFGAGGEIVCVQCEKAPEAGLGISLVGNKDRDKQSVFVVNVKVACPLAIKAGDELLQLNGRSLQGINHIRASAMIRECAEEGVPIEIVLRRRDGTMEECAIRHEDSTATPTTATAATTTTNLKEEQEEVEATEDPMVTTTAENNENSLPPTVVVNSNEVARKKSFSMERTNAIENGRETLIEIDKDGKGLGLSIVGGSDTVLGTVVLHEVYPDGAAAHDGRLKPGDQVLEVNGINLRSVTHDQAITSLRRTPPKVRLLIYRDVNLQLSLLDPTQIYNIFEVELVKKQGRGLGLSIVGRKNEPGVYVSEIVKSGVAECDGRLMTGDQILAVNGKDVANCMQEDVATLLKTITGKVHLRVGRWKITETANRVHAATEALAKSATTPRVEEPTASTSKERDVPPPAPPTIRPIITHTAPDGQDATLSPVTEEPSSGGDFTSQKSAEIETEKQQQHQQHQHHHQQTNHNNTLAIDIIHDLKEEGSETLLVELRKVTDQQLGMGIGKRTRGILVTSLQPGSTAAEKLRVGDRIMAVNALPISDQLSAVTFVKASGERLFLQIARPRLSPS